MKSDQAPIARTANPADSQSIADLIFRSHTISFAPFASESWSKSRDLVEYQEKWEMILGDQDSDNSTTFVAELSGQIVGTVTIAPGEQPGLTGHLNGMHVEPKSTGHGIGGLLMDAAIEFIADCGFEIVELGVIAANHGARRFYERHGWKLARELPDGVEGVPVAIYALTDRRSGRIPAG